MMESQPAKPPSGGMISVFSLTFIVPSGVEGAARDLSGVSAGMMKPVKNQNSCMKSGRLTILLSFYLINQKGRRNRKRGAIYSYEVRRIKDTSSDILALMRELLSNQKLVP